MSDPSDTDAIWKRAEIDSPCVKTCVIDPGTRLCVGCLRSIDEIGAWSQMAPPARRAVMDALPARVPLLQKRRGGRAARIKD